MDINLKGPFLLSLAVGKHMLARREGESDQHRVAETTTRPVKGVLPVRMSKAGMAT